MRARYFCLARFTTYLKVIIICSSIPLSGMRTLHIPVSLSQLHSIDSVSFSKSSSPDANGYLEKVIETTGIQIVDGKIQCDNAEVSKWITSDTMVSMNMWAGYPDFLHYIDKEFARFLDTLGENPEKKEYLLPNIVAELLDKNLASVKVLNTSDRWIGITYKEDIEPAQKKFRFMIENGTYLEKLWK